jgi:RimJ/RimL family protein N-acetyltransferase
VSEPGTILVRRLAREDAAIYRSLRLIALESEPEAFSADLDQERGQDIAWFERRLARPEPSGTFGAFLAERLVGMASLIVNPGAKQRHRGLVVGVFVAPEARGRSVGFELLGRLLDDAAGRVDIVDLAVATGNGSARALYARLGFRPYGIMRDALRVNGRSIDEELLSLDLRARE